MDKVNYCFMLALDKTKWLIAFFCFWILLNIKQKKLCRCQSAIFSSRKYTMFPTWFQMRFQNSFKRRASSLEETRKYKQCGYVRRPVLCFSFSVFEELARRYLIGVAFFRYVGHVQRRLFLFCQRNVYLLLHI